MFSFIANSSVIKLLPLQLHGKKLRVRRNRLQETFYPSVYRSISSYETCVHIVILLLDISVVKYDARELEREESFFKKLLVSNYQLKCFRKTFLLCALGRRIFSFKLPFCKHTHTHSTLTEIEWKKQLSDITKHTLNKLAASKVFSLSTSPHRRTLILVIRKSFLFAGACGIIFGHTFDTTKTWQQVHKTSELIIKFSSQLSGFIIIVVIIRLHTTSVHTTSDGSGLAKACHASRSPQRNYERCFKCKSS